MFRPTRGKCQADGSVHKVGVTPLAPLVPPRKNRAQTSGPIHLVARIRWLASWVGSAEGRPPFGERFFAVPGQGCTAPKPPRAANPGMQSYMGSPALIHTRGMPAVPFKVNADRHHHIPQQRHRITNWSEYDAALRQHGGSVRTPANGFYSGSLLRRSVISRKLVPFPGSILDKKVFVALMSARVLTEPSRDAQCRRRPVCPRARHRLRL